MPRAKNPSRPKRPSRMTRLRASMTQFPDIEPPSPWLLAFEQRAFWEFWAGLTFFKTLQAITPHAVGHPLLVIPGPGRLRYLDDPAAQVSGRPRLRDLSLGAGAQQGAQGRGSGAHAPAHEGGV